MDDSIGERIMLVDGDQPARHHLRYPSADPAIGAISLRVEIRWRALWGSGALTVIRRDALSDPRRRS